MKRERRRNIAQLFAILILVAGAFLFLKVRGRAIQPDSMAQLAGGELKVHFLDVGQADCILIQAGSGNMLIDAGNNDDSEFVLSYLKEQGISKLDYVIGTHAHEDHIGSLDDVILNFEIGELFLPDQTYETQSYTDVLIAAENRELSVTHPRFKDTRHLGEARFVFAMPDADKGYTDVNDSSLGIRITNGVHSFLMCGDASEEMETEFLNSHIYLRADVMKASHHGSSDANSLKFLQAVAPDYVVISCGKDNDFGHPHKRALNRFREVGAEIFRTDEQGTVIFDSDGKTLTCNRSPLD